MFKTREDAGFVADVIERWLPGIAADARAKRDADLDRLIRNSLPEWLRRLLGQLAYA